MSSTEFPGLEIDRSVSHSILKLFYAASDVVMLPTHAEAFAMVLPEAGHMGIPVITYLVGRTPEALGLEEDREHSHDIYQYTITDRCQL